MSSIVHRTRRLLRERRPSQRAGLAAALACALLTLGACGARDSDHRGGGGAGDGPDSDASGGSCALDEQLAFVDAAMRDYYLFYDRVARPRLSDFASPEQLIEALRVPPDRFSYVGDATATAAFFDEGKDFGYGWRLDRLVDGSLVIVLVEPASPLAAAGARRGDIVLTIAGVDERTLTTNAQYLDLLGSGDDTRTVTLGLEDPAGALREIDVTRGEYPVTSVLGAEVRDVGPSRVGYLNFLTFIEPSRSELDEAFATFTAAGIDELVIDLRFNGGGRVDVANELASRIVGAGAAGRDFVRFRLNDKYEAINAPESLRLPFVTLADSLALPRVHVLSSDRTCSASEMVINALEPFVDVVVIGGRSCGKPYGFSGREFCGKVIQAVEIEFVNDVGVGGYVDGIGPDCAVQEDAVTPLGALDEPLYAGAIGHMQGAGCPAVVAAGTLRGAQRTADGGWAHPNPLDPTRSEIPAR